MTAEKLSFAMQIGLPLNLIWFFGYHIMLTYWIQRILSFEFSNKRSILFAMARTQLINLAFSFSGFYKTAPGVLYKIFPCQVWPRYHLPLMALDEVTR